MNFDLPFLISQSFNNLNTPHLQIVYPWNFSNFPLRPHRKRDNAWHTHCTLRKAIFEHADVYIRVCALACGPYSNTLCLFPFDPTRAGFEPLNVEFDTRHTQRNKLSVVRTCRRSGNAYCGHHDAAFGKFSMFDVLNNRLGFGIFCLKKILIRNFCRRWNLSKLSANIYALLFVNH